jgi:serine/threonine-protein kinase
MMRGPLSVRETVSILKDVTRALAFAHGRGVIHRDIKPDNVLLSAGAAVVTDFGVAKALSLSRQQAAHAASSTLTGVGMSPGTPAYMAPEQAAADPKTDHRADLYSLGILGYEMLAGTPPFHGRSPQALLAAQLSEPPPPLSARRYDVPKMLADLLMECLQKDPKRRPESANAVLRSLEDPDIVSGVFDAPVHSRRGFRRPAMLVSGVVLIAAASVAWAMYQRNRDQAAAVTPPPVVTLPGPSIERSIAVLPLEAVGQDPQARAVAQGITSELTNAMASIAGMRVVSQSAAAGRSRTDSTGTPNVAMLVEGTVQRERTALRVVVRVVHTAGDSTLWGQTFNGVADSTLQLQSSVVQAVTAGVISRLIPVAR